MLRAVFEAHPRSVGETYLAHLRRAFGYAGVLLAAGAAAAVHGLVPCFFETTASRAVARLHEQMRARRPV